VRAYEHVARHTEIERTSTVGLAKAPLTGYPVTKLLIRQDIEFFFGGETTLLQSERNSPSCLNSTLAGTGLWFSGKRILDPLVTRANGSLTKHYMAL